MTVAATDAPLRTRLEDAWIRAASPRALALTASAVAPRVALRREPGWYFDKSETDARPRTRFRRAIWRRFEEEQISRPVRVRWHARTRLHLYLGNDLSKCIFVGGAFEPNEFAFLDSFLRPGMTFVDVGANEGVYSVFAARRVGRDGCVIAIEPSSREYARLERNVAVNRLRNVRCLPVAVGSAPGATTLAIAGYGHEGQNTLGTSVANPKVATVAIESVRLRTLDEIAEELELARIDFVKLDIEGSEASALAGCSEVLNTFRPLVQLELQTTALANQGQTDHDVMIALRDARYAVWTFDSATGRLTAAGREAPLSANVVAAPEGWRPE